MMVSDRLSTLIRLRETALDDARQALSEVLAAEQAARAIRDNAEAAIVTETLIAMNSDTDADVARFATWLHRGRAQLAAAETALAEAVNATAHKRVELTLVRDAAQRTAQLRAAPHQTADAGAPDRRRWRETPP